MASIVATRYPTHSGTREQLGLQADAEHFLLLRRLSKGHPALLAAFAHVVASHPRTRLLLVGDGELHTEVESIIDRLRLRSRDADTVLTSGVVAAVVYGSAPQRQNVSLIEP